MPDSGDRALHNKNIRARFLRNPAKFGCALRNGTHRSYNTCIFNLAHTRRNQILLDGFLVNSLQQRSNLGFACIDDFLQDHLRFLSRRKGSGRIRGRSRPRIE